MSDLFPRLRPLEEAVEEALFNESAYRYALTDYDSSLLARYFEILDMIGGSEVWNGFEQRYTMTDPNVLHPIGILLRDFERSQRQRTYLTPSDELFQPLAHIRKPQHAKVRLIINHSLFGPQKFTGKGPFNCSRSDQSDQGSGRDMVVHICAGGSRGILGKIAGGDHRATYQIVEETN